MNRLPVIVFVVDQRVKIPARHNVEITVAVEVLDATPFPELNVSTPSSCARSTTRARQLASNLILLLTVKGVDEFCLDEILRGDFLWKSVDSHVIEIQKPLVEPVVAIVAVEQPFKNLRSRAGALSP